MKELSSLLKSLNGKKIAYDVVYTKITGRLTAGVMLSQLMYWYSVMGGREFYKSNEELCEETGLSIDELKSAKKLLESKGFIKVELKSLPRKTYYTINEEVLINALTSGCKSHQPVGGNSTDCMVEIPPTTSESTTENKTDIYINEKNLLDDLPITKELEVEKKKKGRKKVERHLLTEEEEKWLNNLDEETISKLVSTYEIDRDKLKNFASDMVHKIRSGGYMYSDIKATLRVWLGREFKKKEKLLRYQDDPQEFLLRLEVRNQMLLDETLGTKKTEQEYIAMLEDLRKKGLPKYEL
jgi:hypothetical protein